MTPANNYWQSLNRARLTRRRALIGAASLGASAALWAACGDGGTDESDAGKPVRGGVLRTGTTVPFSGLDPQTEAGTGLAIAARIYGYLLHVNPADDSVIFDQAESLEQPDPTTYVISIRKGVDFQDIPPTRGRDLTAEDAARSIDRFRANILTPTRTFHSTILDRAEATDDLTLRVTTKRPYVYTLSYLGDISAGAILPTEYIEASTSLYTHAAGSGPYNLDSATPPTRARIIRHGNYYRAPIPYLDAMEWHVFPDAAAKFEALQAHSVDVMPAGSRSEVQSLADENPSIEVTQEPSLSSTAVGMRCDRPPFNDSRVRGAIDLALDCDALIQDIAFGDARILGPVNPELSAGFWSLADDDLRAASGVSSPVEIRREEASQLLAAAGASSASFALQVADTPASIALANAVRDQLQSVGLTARLEPLDLLSWFTNFRGGRFEATLITHLPYESPDVPLRFYHSQGPDVTGSPFAFADPAIDALVERSWGEDNREARQATIREAQALMINARPMLQLYTALGYSAAWKQVQNRRPGLLGSLAQYNYEQWIDA